jgi:FtsZ-interacting cell division protein ZipA
MAVASLISMLGTLRIDGIINHTLYGYGLQFSTKWAIPYWTTAAIVFSMGWFIIIIAGAFELHLLMKRWHGRNRLETPSILLREQAQKETPRAETSLNEKPEKEEVKAPITEPSSTEKPAPVTEPSMTEKPEKEETIAPITEANPSATLDKQEAKIAITEANPSEKLEIDVKAPVTEPSMTEKPEKEEVKTSAPAVKPEAEQCQIQALLQELFEPTNPIAPPQKKDNKPKNDEASQ